MSDITISESTWKYEKHLAQESLDMTGHLPEGNQSGAKFWDMVERHYENDVATTGNDKRFLENHCHFVDTHVPPHLTAPVTPVTPVTLCPVIPPSSPPPSYPGTPGTPGGPPVESPGPGGAVPEPASMALVSLGLVLVFLASRFCR